MMLSSINGVARLLSGMRVSPNASLLTPLGITSGTQTRGWKMLIQPHAFPQKNYEEKNPENGRHELAKDGYGVTLYDLEDGKRKNLSPVVMRFKRLEWGAWIRPRAGRFKKLWKKNQYQLLAGEKHVFCKSHHRKRFDRAVTQEYKEPRHIPGDPYKVYNQMSWHNYHSIKLKNINLIKNYGPKNYDFPQHVAHYHHLTRHHQKDKNNFYEPPGYHSDIHSGVYSPDPERPQDVMPPDYLYKRRHHSKTAKSKEARYWREIRKYESVCGVRLSPCSQLRLPVAGTELG